MGGSGSSGSNKMGLTPPSQPTGGEMKLGGYSQAEDFSSPVSLGGQDYGITGGGNQLTATNKETGKSVSSKDYKPDKDYSVLAKGLTSFSPSQSEQVRFSDYGFSPQASLGYGDPASIMRAESGAIWGDKENEDSLTQFLQWQRKMGY